MNHITAVIPTLSNTNGLHHLLTELKSSNIPAIVIDNGYSQRKISTGVALVDSPGVIFLNQSKNLFFAAAVNLGIKQAHTEWILIANDDIEGVSADKLNHMIETADENKWVAVSPILKSPKGTVENIGYQVLPIGRAELNFDPQKNSDKDIDGLTMASLLVKKDVYEKLGGLDESFIAYLEDVDFFLRLKKAGFHFGVDADIEVIHNHMSTSSKMKGFKQKRDLINWIKVINKNWDRSTIQKYVLPIFVERLRNLNGLIKSSLA